MFGYACNETADLMPLPIWTAHRLSERLAEVRKSGQVPYLRPDGKTQVTFEYEDGKPVALKGVLISTQHQEGVDRDTVIRPDLIDQVIRPIIPEQFADDDYDIYVNPTGNFVRGGPYADCGLTGRKIIVDTYGGMGRHGGGAFSGKDPSKVDRSAAYAGRWVAKHVVASGAADRCEVQLAYAIGMAQPMSILVETFGTAKVDPASDRGRRALDVRPAPRRHRARPRPEAADLPARPRPTATSAGPASRGKSSVASTSSCSPSAPEPTPSNAIARSLIARVLPDVSGLDRAFDYLVPDELRATVEVGTIVRVDLHGRRVGGWVIELADEVADGSSRPRRPIARSRSSSNRSSR